MLTNDIYNKSSKLNQINSDLLSNLISIKDKREKLKEELDQESQQKNFIYDQYEKIKEELMKVNKKLENDYKNRAEIESIIKNTQIAYEKILENTKTLHSIIKKDESILISKRNRIEKMSSS